MTPQTGHLWLGEFVRALYTVLPIGTGHLSLSFMIPGRGGSLETIHPHLVQMWQLKVREVSRLTQNHTVDLTRKPWPWVLAFLLHPAGPSMTGPPQER